MKRTLVLLMLLTACERGGLVSNLPGVPSSQPDPVTPPGNNNPTPIPVEMDDPHGADLLPPPMEPEKPVRSRRRMDLDQLDNTIRTVTGGIGWTETRGSTEVDLFQDMAATLGKPDFVENTIEDLEPSALFLKFMDDAARSVCNKVVVRETTGADDTRALFIHIQPAENPLVHADKTEANLRALLLRFHGRQLPAGSPQLEHWKWLVQSVMQVKHEPVETWRAVCVGLMTHPDFYSY